MGNNRATVLEARHLRVTFPGDNGEIVAVKDFSIKIHEGEIVGLVGETGSGKSTAALALQGLVRPPGKVAAGSVSFVGKDLLTMKESERRAIRGRDIGMIVQDPKGALNPMLRVGDQICNVYRSHHRVSYTEARGHAISMLKLVGINDPERRINAYPHELSGGMAQRVLIAIALSSRPKLLIADEPTSGLDVTIQAQVLDGMWESVQQTGSAILLVTQNLGIIANYCDRVAIIHDGEIVEDARVVDFFRAPQHHYSQSILHLQRDDTIDQTEDGAAVGRRLAPAIIHREKQGGEALVEVDRLTKYFPVKGSSAVIQAVHEVSFKIEPGETLGLVGESGSGKTTVGRCLLRLVEPTSGEIRYRGTSLSAIPQDKFRAYRSRLQIVFQNPFDSLNPRWSVWDTLKEPLDLHTDLSPHDKKKRVEELMQLVGLSSEYMNYLPRRLSAGKQQRISIARAIATNPEYIVLDEPTSAMAPAARAEITALLVELQNKLGLSYLFISHDLSTVKYLCHRVAVMYLGQIVEIGSKDQVFGQPQHPYSKALLSAVLFPDPHNRRIDHQVREALQGEIPSPINLPRGCYLYSRCPIATERCREMPQLLTPLDDRRQVRCWRVVEGDLLKEETPV